MKIQFEKEEAENIFYNALCNAVGTGLIGGYGLKMGYDEEEYRQARELFKKEKPNETPCWEDVLMEILRSGNQLTLIDEEGDGEYTRSITLQDVHERVSTVSGRALLNIIQEQDDADDADIVIQTVFFKEVVFG
jgi:NAD(P)H-dependent flavin oxidoreductase YrpB (nitropropane dioxygenase family)